MNEAEVQNIIETTLKSGSKEPGLFDLPKILLVKLKLESCDTISEIIGVLEDNRSLIYKAFGLSESAFNAGVSKLKILDVATV